MIFSRDTSPEAERVLIELLRKKSVGERLSMVWDLNAVARSMALIGIRAKHPDAGPEVIETELRRRILGRELASQVQEVKRARPIRTVPPAADGERAG